MKHGDYDRPKGDKRASFLIPPIPFYPPSQVNIMYELSGGCTLLHDAFVKLCVRFDGF